MSLPKSWTTVTPLSKKIALICFVLFPIIGFFVGVRYEQVTGNFQDKPISYLNDPSPTPAPVWKTYTNTKYGFSFQYPEELTMYLTENNNEVHIQYPGPSDADLFDVIAYPTTLAPITWWKQQGHLAYSWLFNTAYNHISLTSLGNVAIPAIEVVGQRKSPGGATLSASLLLVTQGNTLLVIHDNTREDLKYNKILSTFELLSLPTPTVSSTCIPRPPCLDATPRCMIAESPNMCPAKAQ